MTTFGSVNLDEKPEGIGLKWPIGQKVVDIEVRTQKEEIVTPSTSKDLQSVSATIALNYHVQADLAADMYQNIGLAYRSRIIQPAVEEMVKSVSAKYTAEELISKRALVRDEMKRELNNRLSASSLVVDDFSIVNFEFSEEFDRAIEAKVTAEQLKLKAERDLERIRIEKEQKITQAQAEAESIRIQSEALQQNQQILDLRWIEKWDGQTPKVVGSEGSLINIGLNDLKGGE